MKTLLLAACCGPAIALSAYATTASAQALEIRDYVGRIEIVTGDYAGVEADLSGAEGVSLDSAGAVTRIDGGVTDRVMCRTRGGQTEVRVGRQAEWRRAETLPLIRITAPASLSVVAENSHLDGRIGAVGSAELGLRGCGDLAIGDVAGDLTARLAGGGAVAAGDVGGDLDGAIGGSGSLTAGDVSGKTTANNAGSGAVTLDAARGGAAITIAGSGNVRMAAAEGRIQARVAGSGGVDIAAGEAEEIDLTILGAGEVSFGGAAKRLKANIAGSGDVVVAQAETTDVKGGGSGDVRVNGVRVR